MRTNYLTATLVSLCCLGILSSCDSDDEQTFDTGTLYIQAEMDGKMLLLPEGKDGYESKAMAQTTASASGCAEIQSMQLAKVDDSKKSIEILFVKQRANCSANCEQSKAMLSTGNYSFGRIKPLSDIPVEEGVVIRYTDVSGKVWSTDFGTADQQNSTFTITSISANTIDNRSQMLTTAEFDCVLYDEEGREIEMTNGKVISRSIVCN